MRTIAFNLSFITPGPLTGPGYYAVQLFEHIVREVRAKDGARVIGYIQSAALHHLSPEAQAFVHPIPELGGRISRVLYEQLILPFRTYRDRVDLLFSPSFVSPLWGRGRKVATVCDMYYRTIPGLIDAFQVKYWSIMIPMTARVCSRVVTISEHSKADIEKYLPVARGKTISIPLASRFKAAPVERAEVAVGGTPYVLMVANLTRNKNPEVVVEAVTALNRAGRPIRFVHAGSDPYGLLRDSIVANDASSFVESLGKVSDEQLAELYAGCLVVAAPSLYEGFGMPAVEAQSMGAPLIASDRAALPEAGGDAALYFDPTQPAELVKHLETVMGLSAEERADLVRRSLESAARFSWERTARETLAVFEEEMAALDR